MTEWERKVMAAAEALIEITPEDAGVVVGQFATVEWRRRLRALERAVRSAEAERSALGRETGMNLAKEDGL